MPNGYPGMIVAHILICCVLPTYASALEVGRTYWRDYSVGRMDIDRIASSRFVWLKVLGESPHKDHSIVELSNGETMHLTTASIAEGVEKRWLVPYDPVAKSAAAAKQRASASRAAHIKLVNSKPWPAEIKNAVLKKEVLLGMTPEQVTMAWGKPQRINRSVGRWGNNEQWVYGSTYLYFDNDKLTSFQDSR